MWIEAQNQFKRIVELLYFSYLYNMQEINNSSVVIALFLIFLHGRKGNDRHVCGPSFL